MSRDWRLFINDLLESCEKVRRYAGGMTQPQFLADDRAWRFDNSLRGFNCAEMTARILGMTRLRKKVDLHDDFD